MTFQIGLSGLNAAAADLEVTGNNIANSATTGFKESRAEFSDVYAQAYGWISKTSIGSGVRLAATTQQFSQGNLEYTDNAMDLAIDGEGFFVLDDGGSTAYTRDGSFEVDRNGYVVTNSGQRLQVYAPLEQGVADTGFTTGALSDLQLDFGNVAPQATETINADINLRSDATQILDSTGTAVAFDETDPTTYNYSTSVTVYDSLGTPRTATLYFAKTATAGEWDVYTQLDGASSGTTALGPTTIQFDSNGELDPASVNSITAQFDLTNYSPDNGATIGLVTNGATVGDLTIDLSSLTQYGDSYSVSELSQDGYTTGQLNGFDVDQSGVVFARYTNGQSVALGKVALANFSNPQGLQQLGDNDWAESYASGGPTFGDPGTGSLGLIQSGALESSNVDITEQLVNLITAQRNYQANAQTISTADEITQTVLNIR